jgi:hypothetical protein
MEGSRHAMAQPENRLEEASDTAVGVDGVERQLQPAAVSQRVAASKAAAEKRTANAMSADERAIKRRADQRRRRANATDRGEQHGRATAAKGEQHSRAEAEETVESAVEHLGLPPLTAVRPDARATAAVMLSLSLPPPPQPPAQRTAADSAAAERAAKRAAKARRAERHQQMFEEYERALDFELMRGSAAWRRICDPSDDEGMMPCPEACGAVWEEEDEAEDEAAEDDQATADRPAATSSSSSGWLSGYTLSRKYGSLAGARPPPPSPARRPPRPPAGVKPGSIRPSTSSGDFVEGVHPWDLE